MSIDSAKKFIKKALADSSLRDKLNAAKDNKELMDVLSANGYLFTYSDFDNAYHNTLIQCQFEEQADQLKEFKMWWEMCLHLSGVPLK